MGHVFLSYSSSDRPLVQQLISSLEKAGLSVWIDHQRIRGGTQWTAEIVDAIDASVAVLIALSPSSMESDHVRKEVTLAVDAKKLIVPVWIERTPVSRKLKYYLADIQQIDLASDFDAGFGELLETLKPIVQGKLDSILSDPQMTTREKIDAWIKARTQHKEPDEIRIDSLDEKIQELLRERAAVDLEIVALEERERSLRRRGVKPVSREYRRAEQELQVLREKGSALDDERRNLFNEQVELSMARNGKLIKMAEDLSAKYDRIIDGVLKEIQKGTEKD
jgi:hypothetical protein